MWPFTRSKRRTLDDHIDEAIAFAAEEWARFREGSSGPRDADLRLCVARFSMGFRPMLEHRFPELEYAPAELVLLIIAEGAAASGDVSRGELEQGLGIILPRKS